ncbi:heme biosynthesis HemY N-terminal domain-containing protein [Breoghania sp. L-A4]|uniref:heme biosynthesis protein HemY n=1 Tax=Breoghania sp. L-A4 TaxID=2304600 RepID=UPI000E35A531|nr:heme biosynthesis HemY N-terminal domain-containing protein [Breoghania sp. L-A4]AXS42240.1 heme biosynthesis protein HemY [Breoghania sp. L-A4]
MIRVFVFFAVVFLIAIGGAWLADRPGEVMIDWQGYRIEISLMTLAISIGVLVMAGLMLWSILRWLVRSPDLMARFFRRRRKDRGFDALSRGLIALGAGDARSARKLGNEAMRLLDNEPAAKLLLAQTAQLSGDRDAARQHFEEMLEDPETRLLGLHGLFVEAERQNEPVAARHYAQEAHKMSPGLGWAGKAVLGYQAAAGDWENAIATLERNAHARLIDKPALRRQKAVLLTARAMQLEDGEPDRARTLAVEAHGLAPDLVPAAVIAARLLTRRGDVRKASKTLETTWKQSPHPDIASAYAHVRSGDSARDRLKRVKALVAMRGHVVEGGLAIAREAIDARDWSEARERLREVLRSRPTQRAFLLMAELEEGEHGDRGRMREWLSRAVRAARDPAWTADGVVLDEWAPVSPVTGRLDAFEWKAPVEEISGPAVEGLEEALVDLAVLKSVEAPPAESDARVIEADSGTAAAEPARKPDAAQTPAAAKPAEAIEPASKPATPPAAAKKAEPEANSVAKPVNSAKTVVKPAAKADAEEVEDIDFPLPRRPDDPGPDAEDEPEPKRSRLFS